MGVIFCSNLQLEAVFVDCDYFLFKLFTLFSIVPQDWLDIDFGIAEGVDFIAVSFVKTAEVIKHLKSYIKARARDR